MRVTQLARLVRASLPIARLHCSIVAVALACSCALARAQTVVPSDAEMACILTDAEFSKWLVPGSAVRDGAVAPP
jgi:hypothetical protein